MTEFNNKNILNYLYEERRLFLFSFLFLFLLFILSYFHLSPIDKNSGTYESNFLYYQEIFVLYFYYEVLDLCSNFHIESIFKATFIFFLLWNIAFIFLTVLLKNILLFLRKKKYRFNVIYTFILFLIWISILLNSVNITFKILFPSYFVNKFVQTSNIHSLGVSNTLNYSFCVKTPENTLKTYKFNFSSMFSEYRYYYFFDLFMYYIFLILMFKIIFKHTFLIKYDFKFKNKFNKITLIYLLIIILNFIIMKFIFPNQHHSDHFTDFYLLYDTLYQELISRSLIYNIFKKITKNVNKANILQSILFVFWHNHLFEYNIKSGIYIISLFIAGYIYGRIKENHGIITSWLTHFIYNLLI